MKTPIFTTFLVFLIGCGSTKTYNYNFSVVNQDVVLNKYESVLKKTLSWFSLMHIEISEIDSVNGVITGTFNSYNTLLGFDCGHETEKTDFNFNSKHSVYITQVGNVSKVKIDSSAYINRCTKNEQNDCISELQYISCATTGALESSFFEFIKS